MRIRIDPRVDFAFKRMLGSPNHPAITIHFINAMLRLAEPVVEVEILNPLIDKERVEDKVIALDVLARDSLGRRINIEMQTRFDVTLPNRLLFYNCKNFLRQLDEGVVYAEMKPVISICLIDRLMFSGAAEQSNWRHSFRLRCDQDTQLILTDDFEFHIFELPKFHVTIEACAQLPLDQKWIFLFKHATDLETELLGELLGDEPYREALGVLEMISKTPEELELYEARMKFLRDQENSLYCAKREGHALGRAVGHAEGLDIGVLVGKIQLCQELLGELQTSRQQLELQDADTLTEQLDALNARLKKAD